MASFISYAVSVTTPTISGKPLTEARYGVLMSNGSPIDWPEVLTTISIAGLKKPGPITPTVITTITEPKGKLTLYNTYGQLLVQDKPVTWPATATGALMNTESLYQVRTTSRPPPPPPPSIHDPSDPNAVTSPEPSPVSSSGSNMHSASSIPTGSSHSGLSAGAVAGIAIGCAIVGIFIGAAVSCFVFRYKRARNRLSRPYELDGKPAHPAHELDGNTYAYSNNQMLSASHP